MNPEATLTVMFKEPLSIRRPLPGIPSTGHCKGQRYLPPLNNLNSEERMEKEERKTRKKEERMYLRKSGNPSASPRFTSALHRSWLLTQLRQDQVSLFLRAKGAILAIASTMHSSRLRITFQPSQKAAISIPLSLHPTPGTELTARDTRSLHPSGGRKDASLEVGASNLRSPRSLPAPSPFQPEETFLDPMLQG